MMQIIGRRGFLRALPVFSLAFASGGGTIAASDKDLAPDFTLSDLAGKRVTLSSFKGKLVVIDFWATWCEPCIADIPKLNELHERYRMQSVQLLSIAAESGSAKNVRETSVKHGIRYPVLIGTDAVTNKYKVFGYPTAFLIDSGGKIRKVYAAGKASATAVDRDLQLLLAEN
jgi:thiol-disulfide isomerase/thioredoxin